MQEGTRVLRWLTGLSLGIGLLVVLNQLQVPFYLYYPRTTQTVLISDSFDLYLFLISSVCVLGTFVLFSRKLARSGLIGILAIWAVALALVLVRQSYGVAVLYVTVIYAAIVNMSRVDPQTRRSAVVDVVVCALAIFVLIEFATLWYWVASSVNPQGQFGLFSEELEANLTYSLFPVTMLMLLLLLFSWFWIPMAMRFPRLRGATLFRYQPDNFGRKIRLVAASLDLFAILAILVFFYPYMAGQTWIVGVDSQIRYLKPLNDLAGLSPSQAFFASYRHGLYVVLLYVIELVTGISSTAIVKFAPLLLAFMTGIAVFLAVLRAGWSFQLAILSSMCALLWLPTTLGVYAGIQANWAAFVLWMLFLGFFFMSPRWNVIVFIVEGLISLAIFLIHPWSWGVFLASLVLTAIVSSRSTWTRRRCLQGVSVALSITLPLGIVAYQFLPGFRSDLADTLNLYTFSYLHPIQLLSFGNALGEVLFNWGSFLSPLLVLVSIVGAYTVTQRSGVARNYLLAWVAVWCLGSILVAPIGFNPANPAVSESELWRMLYVSPLPFLLAMGMDRCLDFSKRLETLVGSEQVSRKQPVLLSAILIAFSAGLFVSENVLVRLLIVLGVLVALVLIVVRFPRYQVGRILIVSFLILLLVNAAFRSLYPLLVDPHNLLGAFPR